MQVKSIQPFLRVQYDLVRQSRKLLLEYCAKIDEQYFLSERIFLAVEGALEICSFILPIHSVCKKTPLNDIFIP